MIHESALLVELSIGVWTAKKTDKKVSNEVDTAKNTRTKAGNYNKSLLAGTASKLEQINKLASSVRVWHYGQTLPWSDNGARLLPMGLFLDYKLQLEAYKLEFETLVNAFLVEYPTLISGAALTLGDLFDREEYPEAGSIARKFAFTVGYLPVPAAGDFRVDVGTLHLQELQESLNAAGAARLEAAMKQAWDRLYDALQHLSTRLDIPAEGKKPVFRDSMVSNAVDLCNLLTSLNITGDNALEQRRQMLEAALVGIDAPLLRDVDSVRTELKSKVDNILDMM